MISDTFHLSSMENENVQVYGLNLLICMLENLHGKIDSFIEPIIIVLTNQIPIVKIPSVKFILIQTVAALFEYNAALSFDVMEKKGYTQGYMEFWFASIGDAKYDFEIK